MHDGQVLCTLCCLEVQLRVHHALDVHCGAPEQVKRLGLVETHLLKVVPRILLEYESAITSQHIRLVEGAHDLLH